LNDRGENHKTNEQDTKCQNDNGKNNQSSENTCNITPPPAFADSSSPSSSTSPESDGFEHLTPVAARTRSFSALKKSYRAKKTQKNTENASKGNSNSYSTEKQSGINSVQNGNKTPEQESEPNQGIVSSTCDGKDVEMRSEKEDDQEETDCSQEVH